MRSAALLSTLATAILTLVGCMDSESSTATEPESGSQSETDPFSPDYIPGKQEEQSRPKIIAKFVECGSSQEELAFDWIVSPFSVDTNLFKDSAPAE